MAEWRSRVMNNQDRRKFLSRKELRKLLSYVRDQADLARKRGTTRAVVDELIFLLLARAGLRTHEVCGLRIEDLPTGHGRNVLQIRDTAGGIVREVDIHADMAESLARFVRLYRKGTKSNDFLLKSERGNPLGYMSLYSKLRRIGQASGIGRLSPSILRHTYMVQLYETERDLRYVQEQTGYASPRTIVQYVAAAGDPAKSAKGGSLSITGPVPGDRPDRRTQLTQTCEACGRKIPAGDGKRIESGQLLCRECLKHFCVT
jgi:integrase